VKRELVREIGAVVGFGLYVGTFVVLFLRLDWLGFWLAVAMLTGSLLIFLFGLPKILTADISLPADTRERLGWQEKRAQP
jgi:hypothetical protein